MFDKQLYRGRFEHITDRKLNSVRIFVSSTFSDTTEERNRLIEYVYPKLREYCWKKYQIQFQYSDMCWGIPSNSHETVDLGLQELDTCCRLSMATNCVIFLSHRYGSCLPPVSIPYKIFQYLEQFTDDQEFLNEMYQLDENYLDKRYFLQSMNHNDRLQNLLTKSAQICYERNLITQQERDEFFISVTAKEIYRALQNNMNQSRRIVCFFREIRDIDKLDSKFYENENQDLLEEIKSLLHRSIHSSDIYTYQLEWNDETKRNEYFSKFLDDFYRAVRSQIDLHLSNSENQLNDVLYNQILEHAIQCNLLIQRYCPRNDILESIRSYLTSTSTSPCLLFGESGTGKSSIMAKLVYEIPDWFSDSDSVSIIIRFLGATPSSSDIRRPFISVIEQICTLYQIPMPTSFDNLKQCFENVLMMIPANEILILLFDSLDQLEVTTLKDLSCWLPEKFPSANIKCIYSTIAEVEIEQKTIEIRSQLQTIYENHLVEIEINSFDRNLADEVLQLWLEQDHRCLTDIQYEWLKPKIILRQSITPLFLSLIYDQTLTWHSYDQIPDRAFLSIKNTNDAIGYLYKKLSIKHGDMIFRRSMRYLQLSGGLTENEIEDILSSDDDVLQSIFVHYLPPLNLFRIPSTLWIRIRNDMHKYLIEKDINEMPCIYFYHRSFQYYQSMDVKQLIIDNEEKLILEKNRLNYYGNQVRHTFDMSYSSKLIQKYQLSSNIIEINRCLTKQKDFHLKKNTQLYNQRRIYQSYININRYDFAHQWTIFNYDFLSAYLLCGEYKISNLLYEFSIGAHDPNGELRFLLKQFESSTYILDRYPENLAFELIYRLYSFRNYLPSLTRNLLQQCLNHCPLQLITDSQRLQSLANYFCSKISFLTIDQHRICIFTDENILYLFSHQYYGFFRTGHIPIDSNDDFNSFRFHFPYVCCLSSKNVMFIINCQDKQIVTQESIGQLVEFIDNENILLISSSNNSLELWNCSTNTLVSEHKFDKNPIRNCIYQNSIIEINFQQSSTIIYLTFDDKLQFQSYRIRNKTINNHTHHILLTKTLEFFYSYERSQTSLLVSQKLTNIDFRSLPKSVIHLHQSQSIAWLTSTSLFIFHPIIQQKFYQPCQISSSIDYDIVHDNYSGSEFSNQTNFLACMNKSTQLIDIYEWNFKLNEKQFHYKLLTRFQLDVHIEQFVFHANYFDGLTIFCCDDSTIYKYNATMITYLLSSKRLILSEKLKQLPSIQSNEYLVLKDNENTVNILTINDEHRLESRLIINEIIEYFFTEDDSHILLIDQESNLKIYSLKTSELLWTNAQFHSDDDLQIHSITSSFIIVSSQTKQIFCIGTNKFKLKILADLPCKCLFSTVTSNHRLYLILSEEKTLAEYNFNEQELVILSPFKIQSNKIGQFTSVYHHLLIHTADQYVYLWKKRADQLIRLEKASIICQKQHRFVLVTTDNQQMISYDVKENLRGSIRCVEHVGQCKAINLTDKQSNNEQYLLVIGEDNLLRVYTISNGKQLAKIFIHRNLQGFIGVLKNTVLLKIDNDLCVLKMIEDTQFTLIECPLFKQTTWMICHREMGDDL